LRIGVAEACFEPINVAKPISHLRIFILVKVATAPRSRTTFGKPGRMRLMLESAHEIAENDHVFGAG
jgi:hypothetical protein